MPAESTASTAEGGRIAAASRRPLTAARRTRLALALASLLALAAWALFLSSRAPGTDAALVGFPLDDAWIHLVYARGLATEGGFHYNEGVAEAGMTSPLWVVFAAGVHLVAAQFGVAAVVLGAKLLALLFGVGALWALHALARALGLAPWASLLVAFLAALDPALAFSRAAGMEVPLFTLLVLITLGLALRGETIACGVATGLALVARPEGALVVPSLIALVAIAERGRGASARRIASALAAATLPALLYAAFCLAATGRPLPNTFYAKFVEPGRSAFASLARGWRDYVHGAEPYFTLEVGTLLALVGVVALVVRRGARAGLVLGAGALLFAGTLASRSFSAGHYHYWERWLVPAYPFLLLLFGAGVETARDGLVRLGASRAVTRASTAAVVALLVADLPVTIVRRANEYAWNCRNIEEMNVELGRWVERHVAPSEAIAVHDAGALRYLGKRRTVDLVGLNDHRIKAELRARTGAAYLDAQGVRWFVLFPALAGETIRVLGLEPVHEVRAPVYTIANAPQDRMAVYRWRPDEPGAEPGSADDRPAP